MAMGKWIDLCGSKGERLKYRELDDGSGCLVVVGLTPMNAVWGKAVRELGFKAQGLHLARATSLKERMRPQDFSAVWPNARWIDADLDQYRIQSRKTPAQRQNETEEDRRILAQIAASRYMGRNLDGDRVYQDGVSRFLHKEKAGVTLRESEGIKPHLFLRAPDDASLDSCAQGLVEAMVMGEVQHSEDLHRFVDAVFEDVLGAEGVSAEALRPSLIDRAHSAIDAAIVARLSEQFGVAQDAYGQSVRLHERLPPYLGSRRGQGAMPAPLSAIAQRLLGDTSNLTVVYPNAFDGAAFAFLPEGTRVKAYRGTKDLSRYARMGRAEISWGAEFIASRDGGADALFFNADPSRLPDGSRTDYRDALLAVRALKPGGRAVLVLAGDDPLHPGEISLQSEGFFKSLYSRYEVEDAFEISSELVRKVGTFNSLRVIVARNRAKPGQAAPEKLDALHGWDSVKERVDEALARAQVAQAQSSAGLTLEEVFQSDNDQQSPYLAFSRVGEARTMVPKNLQEPVQYALSQLEAVYGPIDAFVESQLGFGENTLGQRLSPEQVDAVGLSISRMLVGRSNIVADETGIGKGRILASLAVWASKQGRPVVFITDKANLFSDLGRDLQHIGEWSRFQPIITNSDGHIVYKDGPESEPVVLAEATRPEVMQDILAQNRSLGDVGANIVFSTYSQIASEFSDKAAWIKQQLPQALLIIDEAHVAAGSDSNMARQISEMAQIAWAVQFSSATWAKTSNNLHIYTRAFPETVNIASLTDTMKRGGEGFSEVFSSMLARDGALIRREHDLSRLEFVVEVDAANLPRNIRVADQVAQVMGMLSYLSGDLNKLLYRASSINMQALRDAREARGNLLKANLYTSSFGAGGMLYQVQRRMNASLNLDNVVRLVTNSVAEDLKPVIVFEDTGESFVRRIMAEQVTLNEQGQEVPTELIRPPTIRDVFAKILSDISTVRVSEVEAQELEAADAEAVNLAQEAQQDDAIEIEALFAAQDQEAAAPAEAAPEGGNPAALASAAAAAAQMQGDVANPETPDAAPTQEDDEDAPRARIKRKRKTTRRVSFEQIDTLTDAQKSVIREGLGQIQRLVQELPEIPLSIADEYRWRLSQAGLRVGEISGRGFMLAQADGGLARVLSRPKSKALVTKTVREFNDGQLDVVLINRSGAAGLSLHSSPKFRDTRRRVLIESQIPENPTDRIQLYGRVNRYDQLTFPRIVVASTGVRGEIRHMMMSNKKLVRMSANVRSSRESFAHIQDVVDLLNPIGEEVCRTFLLDNPAYAARMAINLKPIDDKTVSAANLFTQRVPLLPSSEGDALYQQVYALFDEAVMHAELRGENPLKPREYDWRASTRDERVLFGIDIPGVGSAFDGAVCARVVDYEEERRPLTSSQVEELIANARRGLLDSGLATQVGTLLDEARTPIVSTQELSDRTALQMDRLAILALASTTFATIDEALASAADNPVRRATIRAQWLKKNLPQLTPGTKVAVPSMLYDNHQDYGVIVSVTPPAKNKEFELAHWRIGVAFPGDRLPQNYTLNSLMGKVLRHTSGEVVSQTVLGGDFLLGRDARSSQAMVNAFDSAPSGRIRRTSTLLTGNMYLASEWATQTKAGTGMIYSDDRGQRHRAILLRPDFSMGLLQHMPVRVWAGKMMASLMEDMLHQRIQPNGHPSNADAFVMHTSFQGAWRAARDLGSVQDALVVVPPGGRNEQAQIIILVAKDQVRRVLGALRSAQKRLRLEAAGPGVRVVRASDDPCNVTISENRRARGAEFSQVILRFPMVSPQELASDGQVARQEAQWAAQETDDSNPDVDHPGRPGWAYTHRALRMLEQGVGLQLYINPNTALGQAAREQVRAFFVERARDFARNDPAKLALIDAYIERELGDGGLQHQDLPLLVMQEGGEVDFPRAAREMNDIEATDVEANFDAAQAPETVPPEGAGQ